LTVVAAAAALAFVLLGIGTPLLGLRTFSAVDLLQSYEPWKSDAAAGFVPHLPAASDTVDNVLPQHQLFGQEVRDGNVPGWDPLAAGGGPLASGPGSAFWTPLNLPYVLLPAWLAPAWAKLLELVVTIGGTFLYARRIGLGRPAGLVGGILFASSGFMVTWTNWPHTQVAALIPALFWAAERFCQLRTVRAAVPIALVVAGLLLGGFPAVAGYALYAVVPYTVLRLLQLTGRSPLALLRSALLAGAATALGVGLVAVLVLPFLAQLDDLDYLAERGQVASAHLPPLMLATTVVWRAFGSAAGGGPYWGPIVQIEGLSFLGAGAAVLVGFALLRRSPAGRGIRGYFVVATLLTVALGYRGGTLLAYAQKLPVFSDNPVARIRSILGFFLAVLAAMGYQALVAHVRGARSRWRVAAELAGWALVALAAAGLSRKLLAVGADFHQTGYVRTQLLWAALPAGLVLVAGSLAGVRRVRTLALAAVPVIVAVESLALVIPFWPRAPKADFYPQTAAHQFLDTHLGQDRYVSKGLTFFPGTNVYYGLRSATGHTFTNREWKELLLTVDPDAFPTPTFSRFAHGDARTVGSPLLDAMSVRYFAFGPQDPVLGVRSTVPGVAAALRPGVPVDVPIGTGAVRGVGVRLTAPARPGDPFAALSVQLVDRGGRTVAQGSRRLYTAVGEGRFTVPVAGEGLTGPLTARLTLRSDAPLALAADLQVTRPDPADGLRLVFTDGAVLYDRTTVLPRFRWADHAQVIPDKVARLTVLANVRDPGRVVLDSPGPLTAAGKPATVSVLSDGTDSSRTRVEAGGAGYLVVADADQAGWTATVDGRTVPLLPADHALVAVPVPAGTHEVALHYTPAGQARGAAVSLASLVLLLAAVLGPVLVRRRRTPPAPVVAEREKALAG
ncbi:MAG TPA: YfhO family protein, partial [Mycobacteriales bacterium]|nr:YfhO family protein [Mycobacteriales bacterium]